MWPDVKLPKNEPFQRIAFYGPMASGKTWCANWLVNNMAYRKYAFADKVKALCYELYGVDSKAGNARIMLQEVSESLKKHDKNVWIKYTLARIRDEEHKYVARHWRGIVIDDVRFKAEAKKLKENGFVLFRVDVDEEERQRRIAKLYPDTPSLAHTHASETEWQDITPDYTVKSGGYDTAYAIQKILAEEI